MGTYSYDEFLSTFGGPPEPGETYPSDPDALIDAMREECRVPCGPVRDVDLVSVATTILTTGRYVASQIRVSAQAGDDDVLGRHLGLLDTRDLHASQIWASVHGDDWLDRVIQVEVDARAARA